jgi:hypothetical protein
MGFVNATVTDPAEAQSDFGYALAPGEQVRFAFKLVRDHILFTDKRIMTVDVQGLTGSKRRYFSVPYRAITTFTIESAGHFDLDTEFSISISGASPIEMKLSRGADVPGLLALITDKISK